MGVARINRKLIPTSHGNLFVRSDACSPRPPHSRHWVIDKLYFPLHRSKCYIKDPGHPGNLDHFWYLYFVRNHQNQPRSFIDRRCCRLSQS